MTTNDEFCPHARGINPQLDLAVRSAYAAGEIIRRGWGTLPTIEEKGVGDLVSQVDREADAVASEMLASASDLPILSEELHGDVALCDDMWIVDPLDGSSAFLMQAGPQYPSVLIALREQGQTSLGVVYFPMTGECFYAARGRGAWLDGRRLICQTTESLTDVWVEMNQYGDARWETLAFAELRQRLRSADGARLVTSQPPHSGVAARIASCTNALAVAVHDNHPRHVKQAPWDIAAPQLLIEEAGGVAVNLDGVRIDPFRPEPFLIARSQSLAQQLIELVVRQDAHL